MIYDPLFVWSVNMLLLIFLRKMDFKQNAAQLALTAVDGKPFEHLFHIPHIRHRRITLVWCLE